MSAKIQIVFYSMYGHVHQLAEAVAAGAREVPGVEVGLFQVPELVPEEALERTGAKAARSPQTSCSTSSTRESRPTISTNAGRASAQCGQLAAQK